MNSRNEKKGIFMFKGAYTALITPFNRSGEVHYERLRKLVEFQVANGVGGRGAGGARTSTPLGPRKYTHPFSFSQLTLPAERDR